VASFLGLVGICPSVAPALSPPISLFLLDQVTGVTVTVTDDYYIGAHGCLPGRASHDGCSGTVLAASLTQEVHSQDRNLIPVAGAA